MGEGRQGEWMGPASDLLEAATSRVCCLPPRRVAACEEGWHLAVSPEQLLLGQLPRDEEFSAKKVEILGRI